MGREASSSKSSVPIRKLSTWNIIRKDVENYSGLHRSLSLLLHRLKDIKLSMKDKKIFEWEKRYGELEKCYRGESGEISAIGAGADADAEEQEHYKLLNLIVYEKKILDENSNDGEEEYKILEESCNAIVQKLKAIELEIKSHVKHISDSVALAILMSTRDVEALSWIMKHGEPNWRIYITCCRSCLLSDGEFLKSAASEIGLEDLSCSVVHVLFKGIFRKLNKSEADHLGFKIKTATYDGKTVKAHCQAELLSISRFGAALVGIFQESWGEMDDLIAKCLSLRDDLATKGETLFEVFYFGGCKPVKKVKPRLMHPYSILFGEPSRERLQASVDFLRRILCGRQDLHEHFQNLSKQVFDLLEYLGDDERGNLATFTAIAFKEYVGLSSEMVFQALSMENLVEEGISLKFLTDMLKKYMANRNLEELDIILISGNVDVDLLKFFPSSRRNLEGFCEHFREAGLDLLGKFYKKKIIEVRASQMKSDMKSHIDAQNDVLQLVETIKQLDKDIELPRKVFVKCLWDALMTNQASVLVQVKQWKELLKALFSQRKDNRRIINAVRVWCCDHEEVKPLFPQIINVLKEEKVVAESSILSWAENGKNHDNRKEFVKLLKPLVKSLKGKEREEEGRSRG